MSFSDILKAEISTSVASTYTKPSRFIPIYEFFLWLLSCFWLIPSVNKMESEL